MSTITLGTLGRQGSLAAGDELTIAGRGLYKVAFVCADGRIQVVSASGERLTLTIEWPAGVQVEQRIQT